MAAKARILAIDDQLYFRNFLEGLLGEEGYEVCSADGQATARALLERQGPFDLVILDLVMPEGEPNAFIREMRERFPDLVVFAVTGAGDANRVPEAMKAGAAHYLQKPIGRESLLQAVGNALEQRKTHTDMDRLLTENLEFMGRVSLIERALGLLALRTSEETAQALLEQLCLESAAQDGVLWVKRGAEGAFVRACTRGQLNGEYEPEHWPGQPQSVDQELRSGRGVLDPPPGEGAETRCAERLYVPCYRAGRLTGIARLSRRAAGGFGVRELDACTKLGEVGALALEKASEFERLRVASFREAATGLPGRTFFDEVAQIEVYKAHRFGRRLSILSVALEGFDPVTGQEVLPALVSAVKRTLRSTDVLTSENSRRFWILVTDTDPLGGVVLKRRIAQRLADVFAESGVDAKPTVGVASYPVDGETFENLLAAAGAGATAERESIVHTLGIRANTPLAEIGERVLAQAPWMPPEFIPETAELLIGELTCRPRDRGLLFLAPGRERSAFMAPLTFLGDTETATDVFIATDGDTIPNGPSVTGLPLPPDVSVETTWVVRYGEGPPYALVAGARRSDGARPVFHSSDPVLVEHMTFRLRTEVGFGVRV
ncbi:MAG: response regulator [bacterium]|nr:response regulator [bacterium]